MFLGIFFKIGFASTAAKLSDRTEYPLFARTVPSDYFQTHAIAAMLYSHLNWTCAHLIYSEGVYGESGAEALREHMNRLGICRASDNKASNAVDGQPELQRIISQIASLAPTTSAIICFCETNTVMNLLRALRDFNIRDARARQIRFVVLGSDSLGLRTLDDVQTAANGAITIKVGTPYTGDLKDYASRNFMQLIRSDRIDPWLEEFAMSHYRLNRYSFEAQRDAQMLSAVGPEDIPVDDFIDSMSKALKVGIYALDNMIKEKCGNPIRCQSLPELAKLVYDGELLHSNLVQATQRFPRLQSFNFMDDMSGDAQYEFYYYLAKKSNWTNIVQWPPAGGRNDPLERDRVTRYYRVPPSVGKVWPDNDQPIDGSCPLKDGEKIESATCPAPFYYPSSKSIDNATLAIAQCNILNRGKTPPMETCQQNSKLGDIANFFSNTGNEDDTKSSTITALAVILAIVVFALVILLAFLIFVLVRCRRYKNRLREELEMKELTKKHLYPPSFITSDQASVPNKYLDKNYAVFGGGSVSSSNYMSQNTRFTDINVVGGASLSSEMYLAPAVNNQQATRMARIRKILTPIGGGEELVTMIDKYLVPNQKLIWGDVLGEGKFAFVYSATLKRPDKVKGGDQNVAVKVMKPGNASNEDIHDFLKEAYLMATFDHPNVISLLGVSLLFDQPHIIIALMSNGNLRDFLRMNSSNLSLERLLNFCLQIAIGMEYLSANKFIHRDLAARNILVDSEGLLKIADFGMSRHLQNNDYYRPVTMDRPLPIRWHPPESLQMRTFDERSDVWSFGVVCWEIFSLGQQPFGGLSNNEVLDHVAAGNRLPRPPNCPERVYTELIYPCWKTAIKERPSFTNLIDTIEKIQKELPRDSASSSSIQNMGSTNRAYAGSTV